MNSFGFGGSNTHIILRPANHAERKPAPATFMKIITYSGRTAEAVNNIFDCVLTHPENVYFQQLLANQANLPPKDTPYRGYMILNRDKIPYPPDAKKDPELSPLRDVQKIMITEPKQIYFIYSGNSVLNEKTISSAFRSLIGHSCDFLFLIFFRYG